MTPDLARSFMDLVVDQLLRLEARTGRRAVRMSVAIPETVEPGRALAAIDSLLARIGHDPIDTEFVSVPGGPRLLTVDFDIQEAN